VKLYLAIMAGGALGSAGRYVLTVWLTARLGEVFPWGTLAVNMLGSFAIGFLAALMVPVGPLGASETLRVFLLVGVLGGFTTFSSFSLQTVLLLQSGQWLAAAGNIALSVLGCLLATILGLAAAQILPIKT
jgi:fluoride exporter